MSERSNPFLCDVTLQRCSLAEYEEMLQFASYCFEKPHPRWFDLHYSHIFQPTREMAQRNLLFRKKGELVGMIGVYPFRIRIGRAVLSVGGIGTVATHPKARGKGIMSLMLRQANHALQTEGYDLSWLTGDRYRYRNYGWDLAGRTFVFHISIRDLTRYYPDLAPVEARRAQLHDIPTVSRLYRRFPARVVRDADCWKARLRRKGHSVEMARAGRSPAYCVWTKENAATIVEINGQPSAALALLKAHMKKHRITQVRITYPYVNDSLGKALFDVAANYRLEHLFEIKVVNVESTWNKLLPEIKRSHAFLPKSLLRRLDTVSMPREKQLLLNRILGFGGILPPLPPRLKAFEPMQPIGWWISDYDGV